MQISLNRESVRPVHTVLSFEPDGVLRMHKVDKMTPDENTYGRVEGSDFHNGVIEVDLCGKLLPDAPDYARGFIGIVFRVNDSDSEFESFYIRPTNGIGCEDPVRRRHGAQYFSYPGYTFSYFREFGIDIFENEVKTIALGKWSHLKAEIHEDTAVFHVDGVQILRVEGMKHGPKARGSVGLYVDIGTDGYFRNLSVTCED